jgi:hypothetical protein
MAYVGCCVCIHPSEERCPLLPYDRTPLAEAVTGAAYVGPGYRVGAFEAEHPCVRWQEKMFWDTLRAAESGTPEAAESVPTSLAELGLNDLDPHRDTSCAHVWYDDINGVFAVIADIELLEWPGFVDWLVQTFELAEGTYRIFVEPLAITDLLESEGLTEDEADVVFDAETGDVVIIDKPDRDEADTVDEMPQTPPRPRPGEIYPLNFRKLPSDGIGEQSRSV